LSSQAEIPVEDNKLIFAVKDAGKELGLSDFIKRDSSLEVYNVAASANRTGVEHKGEKDIKFTYAGKRFEEHYKTLTIDHMNIMNYLIDLVERNYEGQIRDQLITDIKSGKWLWPRGLHCVNTANLKLDVYDGLEYTHKGIIEHIKAYMTEDESYANDTFTGIEAKIREVILEFPRLPDANMVRHQEEWKRRVRTGRNSGYPSCKTVITSDPITGKWNLEDRKVENVIHREEELIPKYIDMVDQRVVLDILIFMAFYRTQAGKSRLVAGAPEYFKVLGALMIELIMTVVNFRNGIAWGNFIEVYGYIVDKFGFAKSCLSVDFSALDTTFHKAFQEMVAKSLIESNAINPSTSSLIECYYANLKNSWMCYAPGRRFKVMKGLESGRQTTQFDDSVLTKAVISYFAERYGLTVVMLLVLGDDVLVFFEEDIEVVKDYFKEFTDDLTLETGLEVSFDKSYPSDITKVGGFGKFLQKYIMRKSENEVVVFGDWVRILASVINIERDSSQIRGVNFEGIREDKRYGDGTAHLARNIQSVASLSPSMPGIHEFLAFVALFERDLLDKEAVEKAIQAMIDYNVGLAFYEQVTYIDYKWLIDELFNKPHVMERFDWLRKNLKNYEGQGRLDKISGDWHSMNNDMISVPVEVES
jgi:hypothetical protein